jgi:hypothetical protein
MMDRLVTAPDAAQGVYLKRKPPWPVEICGPFTTRADAGLAKKIARQGWADADVVGAEGMLSNASDHDS